jgi:NAD(P)-dependent dehydrogenase (short-subunit alcohol dehydrogenase family)
VTKAKEAYGKIDILVNNAATNPTMDSALDASDRAWDSIMNLNLKGLFFLAQAVAKVMKEHGGGVIINVSSVAGVTPDILPIYSISKAGVNMATKVMAQQWAPYGIRANTLSPGQTRTQFSEALWGNPDIYKVIMDRTPLKRIADPQDMANAAVFLASDKSSFITGQNIIVDGGLTI